MVFLLIICIILISYYCYDYKHTAERLRKENISLKEKVAELERKMQNQNSNEHTDNEIPKPQNEVNYVQQTQTQQVQNEPLTAKEEPAEEEVLTEEEKARIEREREEKKTRIAIENARRAKEERERAEDLRREMAKLERDKKNTGILVVGAILVVLAAIVFLMSTWNYTHNLLKTVIMAMFAALFLKLSKIADEKHGLKKASKAFFYIAMAYIPICLISFCVFGLLGEYFSIYGEGRNIYLGLSFIITSAIYYINYNKLKTKELFIGTILSQILAIILFLLTFGESIYITLVVLLVYNLILKHTKFIENELKISNFITTAIDYISTVILVITFFENDNLKVIPMILQVINFACNKTKTDLDRCAINFVIYELGYYLMFIGLDFISQSVIPMIGIIYSIIAFTVQYLLTRKENCKISATFETVSIIIMIILGLINGVEHPLILYTTIILILAYDLIIKSTKILQDDFGISDNICKIIEYLSIVVLTYKFFDRNNLKIVSMIALILALAYKNKKNSEELFLLNFVSYELGYYLIFVGLNNISKDICQIIGMIYTIAISTLQYILFGKDEDVFIPKAFEIVSMMVIVLFGLFDSTNGNTIYILLSIMIAYSLIIKFINRLNDENPLFSICKTIECVSVAVLTITFFGHINFKILPMAMLMMSLMYNKKKNDADLILINIITYELGYYITFIGLSMLSVDIKLIIAMIYTLAAFTVPYLLLKEKYNPISAMFEISSILLVLFLAVTLKTSGSMLYILLSMILGYSLITKYLDQTQKEISMLFVMCKAIEYIVVFALTYSLLHINSLKILPMILVIVALMNYNKRKNDVDLVLANLVTGELGYYIIFKVLIMFSYDQMIIFGIIYSLIIFLIQFIFVNKKSFNVSAVFGLGFITILLALAVKSSVKTYVFLTAALFMMSLILKKNREDWEAALSIVMPIVFIKIFCNILIAHLDIYYLYLILAIIFFVLSEITKTKSKYFNKTIPIIAHIFLSLSFINACAHGRYTSIGDTISNMATLLARNTKYIQDISSIGKNIIALSLVAIYGYNYYKFKKNNEKYSESLLIYAAGIPLICLEMLNPEIKILMYFGITIITTYLSAIKKKVSIETIISLVYLLLSIISIESIYLRLMLGIIWALVNWFYEENVGRKDVYKLIIYLLSFEIYHSLLKDTGIIERLNSFMMLGVLVLVLLISRLASVRRIKDIGTIEALLFAAIYLYAIPNYSSETDGIIFVTGIVFLMAVFYYLRNGSVFVISLIAILVNSILLTRKFWLSVPWWIYLLLIGTILIAFAIKNESDEKKMKKTNPGDVVKKIIDRVERK